MKLYLLVYSINDLVFPRIEDYNFKLFISEDRAKDYLKDLKNSYSIVDYFIKLIEMEDLDLYVRY